MNRLTKVLARILAVLALAAVAVALVVVISSSLSEDDDSGDDEPRVERTQPDPADREDRPKDGLPRFYTVESGDSLSVIEEITGVPIERIQQLNPEIDPQILQTGQRLRIRN